ncbi:PIN domain-containing protein [Roseiarcus sp.]|uniref:PIN domain-containing protein n=1 Tax=Roseiarcus sp. TaxID=1969460 RepID=UPI003F98BC37
MVVDASAIVAILVEEPMAGAVAGAIEHSRGPFAVSPLTVFEAALAMARARGSRRRASTREDIETALAAVEKLIEALQAEEVPVSADLARAAIAAAARFGRAVGHPADLNFGDCFSYALATAREDALLFIGDDFAQTDVRSVLADPRPRRGAV